jgi:hypothetical protein
LDRVKDLFGDINPFVCAFNHDHIFVDYIHQPFVETIENVFNNSKLDPRYLYYSHTPELLSIGHNPKASKDAFEDLAGIGEWFGPIENVSNTCFSTVSKSFIHGYFATNFQGLAHLWNAASITSPYVPRPDWPSVSFPNTNFNCYFSSREFFRHFDGYGHISLLANGLSLQLNHLSDILTQSPKYEMLLESRDVQAELVNFYAKKFIEQSTLAFRNVLYSSWKSGTCFNGRKELEVLLEHFTESYLVWDSKYLGYNQETLSNFRNSVCHHTLSNATALASQALADLVLQNINFTNRANAQSNSLLLKLKRRLSNIINNLKQKTPND